MKKIILPFLIATVLLGLVVADMLLWFKISGDASLTSAEERQQAYLSHFPEQVQNTQLLTLFKIIMLAVAVFVFIRATGSRPLRVLSFVFAVLSGILIVWQIFSLM